MSKRKIIQLLKCVLAVEITMCAILITDINCSISKIETYLEETQEKPTETVIPIEPPVVQYSPPTEPLETTTQEVKTYPNLEIPLDDEYKAFSYEKCNYDDDMYCFSMAVIKCESDFDPYAVSKKDGHDFGFMQLREFWHDDWEKKFNVDDAKSPYDNLTIGIGLLTEYLEKYEYKNLALMCYNCGEKEAKELWKKGVYSTEYTVKVLAKYKEYLEQAGL